MAQYKKGNRILSEDENAEEILSLFGAILFFIGAGVAIFYLNQFVPESWNKEFRFLAIFPPAVGAGYVLSLLQVQAYISVGYLYVISIWTLFGTLVWWLI